MCREVERISNKTVLPVAAAGFVVHWISLVIFLLLFTASLFFTRYFASDYSAEIPLNKTAVFPLTLLGAMLLAAAVLWVSKKVASGQNGERNLHILLGIVLVWVILFGTVWVLICKSTPISDQFMITSSAERFTQGNFGRLEYGKYLYYYPFQLGLVAYEELVFRIFGLNNYVALQLVNVAGTGLSLIAGYRITRYLFRGLQTAACFLLLYGSCFPFLLYSAYVYGDVLAVTLCLFFIWQFLRYIKAEKRSGLLLMALTMTAAVLIRNNSLIVLIACCCVLAVQALAQRRWKYILCILLLAFCVFVGNKALKTFYEERSGVEINDGMPSVLWIAMGMQEGDKEAGWYNGYSVYIYQDVCSYHSPTAAALGKAEIHARAKEFLFHPLYGLDFYQRKFTSQWNDPTYGCFIMTEATEAQRDRLASSIYYGKANRALQAFMDSYQLLIYGAVLALLLFRRRKREALEWYVLLIAVTGGVLFHELWEAKSRYVLPYFVMMLPMAAAGLQELSVKMKERRRRDEIS
jgi:hypothetical protein